MGERRLGVRVVLGVAVGIGWVSGCYSGADPSTGEPYEVGAEGSSGHAGAGGAPADDGGTSGGGDGASGNSGSWPEGDDEGAEPGTSGGADSGGSQGAPEDDASDTGGGGESGDSPPPSDEVPSNAYCNPVADWDPAHVALEDEILTLVNEKRAAGANCGSEGSFGPAEPLTMDPALRCAARVHSKDMDERNFFDHTNPSGESPWDRYEKAGYSYSAAGENIAGGSPTAAGTMSQWMGSDGHCANIMNPDFEEIGVGYHPGGAYGHLWTQTFGRP